MGQLVKQNSFLRTVLICALTLSGSFFNKIESAPPMLTAYREQIKSLESQLKYKNPHTFARRLSGIFRSYKPEEALAPMRRFITRNPEQIDQFNYLHYLYLKELIESIRGHGVINLKKKRLHRLLDRIYQSSSHASRVEKQEVQGKLTDFYNNLKSIIGTITPRHNKKMDAIADLTEATRVALRGEIPHDKTKAELLVKRNQSPEALADTADQFVGELGELVTATDKSGYWKTAGVASAAGLGLLALFLARNRIKNKMSNTAHKQILSVVNSIGKQSDQPQTAAEKARSKELEIAFLQAGQRLALNKPSDDPTDPEIIREREKLLTAGLARGAHMINPETTPFPTEDITRAQATAQLKTAAALRAAKLAGATEEEISGATTQKAAEELAKNRGVAWGTRHAAGLIAPDGHQTTEGATANEELILAGIARANLIARESRQHLATQTPESAESAESAAPEQTVGQREISKQLQVLSHTIQDSIVAPLLEKAQIALEALGSHVSGESPQDADTARQKIIDTMLTPTIRERLSNLDKAGRIGVLRALDTPQDIIDRMVQNGLKKSTFEKVLLAQALSKLTPVLTDTDQVRAKGSPQYNYNSDPKYNELTDPVEKYAYRMKTQLMKEGLAPFIADTVITDIKSDIDNTGTTGRWLKWLLLNPQKNT